MLDSRYVVLCLMCVSLFLFFFFKQKTAYEMRISDWSSDVCSSDLLADAAYGRVAAHRANRLDVVRKQQRARAGTRGRQRRLGAEIGRASCRERVCQYV